MGIQKNTKKSNTWIGIVTTVVLLLATAVAFLVGTSEGRRVTTKAAAGYIHNNICFTPISQSTNDTTGQVQTDAESKSPDCTNDDTKATIPINYGDRKYFHILLLGIEAIDTTIEHGRTDLIMVVTISIPDKKIKVISLLRDTLVQIPGYEDNKLNTVYGKGGISLLYKTIELNYGITPDTYALVGFKNFEKLIDKLGGVEVTLTQKEADYLNTTKYISNPEDRNVVAGTQLMNGAQTLGYCRIRKVPNINGTKYDYGRTERQRLVLNNLFHQYISTGIYEWVPLIREMIGMVQTDISLELLEAVLFAIYDNKITTLDMLQLPNDGMFQELNQVGEITSVIVPDWEKTREYLQQFLFED